MILMKINQKPYQLMKKTPKETGFTLIEVMIVLVLIGIMGVFVAPEIRNFRPNIQLNAASRELYGFFQNAKLAAVKNNKNCVVTFNQVVLPETFSYFLFIDDNKDFIYNLGEEILLSSKLTDYSFVDFDTSREGGDGLSFAGNSSVPSNPAIGFQPNGIPTAPGGVIPTGTAFFKNSSGKVTSVVVGQAGNISIRKIVI